MGRALNNTRDAWHTVLTHKQNRLLKTMPGLMLMMVSIHAAVREEAFDINSESRKSILEGYLGDWSWTALCS